jgi:2-keto-4-pentenoate hydratase/2-oxohepta-3-ene-1,7-dioic acid hydratase in catechol pathway
MKICCYSYSSPFLNQRRVGIITDENTLVDPALCFELDYQREGYANAKERAEYKCPASLSKILKTSDNALETLTEGYALYLFFQKVGINELDDGTPISFDLNREKNIRFHAPLDRISTYRDFYAHEKHVKKGFEKRNEAVPEAWYEIPAYYKGAVEGFIGPDDEVLWPSYTEVLDYELELAIVIGKDGKNIKEEDALDHIFGYTILNDISARDIQKKEMSVRLGPAKGKDFCSVIGPVIVTADEFEGKEPNLNMKARINGELWSEGMSGDSHYSWAQMIAHASNEEFIVAGDLLGSGTVGTGCGLELDKWIQPDDVIELEVEKIGILKNKIGNKKQR